MSNVMYNVDSYSNKSLWVQAGRRRHQYKTRETIQEVTAHLDEAVKDLKKTTAVPLDYTHSAVISTCSYSGCSEHI